MAKTSMKIKQQRSGKILHQRIQPLQNLRPSARISEKIRICRICFRELAYKGEIPGVKKASW